ncbi:MAG: bifunctional alpha/beta hydrolase/OsmC family protein [Pseudomonadota bacterium]
MALKTGKAEFTGAGGERLAARLDVPTGHVRAWALFAHCFSCSKDILAAQRIALRLAELGIGVMRFDFTGLGHSEGDFANTNFSSNVQDLVAAARWLGEETDGPDLLIGHSLGGAAVTVAAHELPSVKAVATIGAPADAEHVIEAFSASLDEIEEAGEAEVSLAGRPFTIKRQFLEDVRGAKVRDAAAELKRPLLVMHSPVDATVGIENATGLFIAAKHPKSFISLDTADHLLTKADDARYVAEMVSSWAGRYLTNDEVAVPKNGRETVHVAETGRGAYQVSVQIGEHAFYADEPASVGGADTGPDPYELVSAGLGACTAMTLRMYANRKGWPLEKVAVELTHKKDHADDCERCEEGRKVDIFERILTIKGELDGEQRERLLEIADKCPVHKTLMEPVMVRTRLSDTEGGMHQKSS